MKAARALRYARSKAGLSQRELAARTTIPQSTIGRIEAGLVDPRVGTLSRLLRACGFDLEVEPRLGMGVDRSQIRQLLALTPDERIASAVAGMRFLESMRAAMRSATPTHSGVDPDDLMRTERASGRPKDLREPEIPGALRDEIDGKDE